MKIIIELEREEFSEPELRYINGIVKDFKDVFGESAVNKYEEEKTPLRERKNMRRNEERRK